MEQSYTLSICSTEHGEWQGSIAPRARPAHQISKCAGTAEDFENGNGERSMKKRVLSILLCLCMAITLLPTAALAEFGGDTKEAWGENLTAPPEGFKEVSTEGSARRVEISSPEGLAWLGSPEVQADMNSYYTMTWC